MSDLRATSSSAGPSGGAGSRPPVRDTIVAAVDTLVRSRGWAATTMADVARAAGVSRQTVYNEFGSRQDLVRAYVVRELDALLAAVERLVRARPDDPKAALTGAFAGFLELASDEPLVRLIVSDAAGAELIRLLTSVGLGVATDRVAGLIAEVYPVVPRADAERVSATLARLAISHAVLPTEPAAQAADTVGRLLGPFVDEVFRVRDDSPAALRDASA